MTSSSGLEEPTRAGTLDRLFELLVSGNRKCTGESSTNEGIVDDANNIITSQNQVMFRLSKLLYEVSLSP